MSDVCCKTQRIEKYELTKVNPDSKEAKTEQAAADLLIELGLEDLEDPSKTSKKDISSH